MKRSFLVIVFGICLAGLFYCKTHKQAAKPVANGQSITEKYWKLTELYGRPVAIDSGHKEPYIIFKANDSTANGNGGCNSFRCTYKLTGDYGLTVSKLANTQMACPEMELESQFLKVLQMTDSYYLKGDSLILNRGRMAPLARFKVLYLK